MIKVCVTGHRKIGGDYSDNPTRKWVKYVLNHILENIKPAYAYSGMAIGVDTDFAELCLEKGIPLAAVIPFSGQSNRWPAESQRNYWNILKKVKEKIVVCEPGFAPWKMHRRNEAMVDATGPQGIVIAVWDGSPSGTSNAVQYAAATGKRIIRVDPSTRTITGIDLDLDQEITTETS